MPEVSVILPCYNAGKFLHRALESVKNQTYTDFEILVVNDGSTDPETLEILEGLGDGIRVIHQENRGLPGARNRGYSEAAGRFVLPLDCDDYLDESYLQKAMALIDGREDKFVFSHLNLIGEKSGVLTKYYNKFEQLFANQLPYCMLVPKSLWEKVGGYDETMRKEADVLRKIADHVAVKVPLTEDGLRVCKELSDDGTMVNVTLCFSPAQAILAAKAGAAFVSPFVGRLDDISQDGLQLISDIVRIYDNYPQFDTKVLVASIRNPLHIVDSAKMGAHVMTSPPNVIRQLYKHPLTDKGLASFVEDWKKTGQSIL